MTTEERTDEEMLLRERDQALARIADYENRITWDTTCGNCARLLDASIKEYERADRAEAAARTAALLLHSVAEHAPAWQADGSDYRIDAAVFRSAAADLDRLAPPEGTSE